MNAHQLQKKAQSVVCGLYEKNNFSHDLVVLYVGRIIMRTSFSLLGLFMPMFFFKEYGYNIQVVVVIYVSLFGLVLLLTPLSARLLNIFGTRKMILISIVFATLSIGTLYFFSSGPVYATLFYIGFAAIYKVLYWVPYQVDFAYALNKTMRGRQLAVLRNMASIVLVAVPAIGGVIISVSGFKVVFLIAMVIMIFSLIPLWHMRSTYERFSWGYLETFMHLFSRKNRALFLAYSAGGVQGITSAVFWPVYIFMLLDQRFTILGIIASLTIIFIIILRTIVGRLFDTWSHKRILLLGIVMASTGWITKLFVQTPFQVFAADSYHNFGRTVNSLSFDATTYEQLADNGTYVDEYTALKEMSLAIGRIVMLLLMSVLVAYFDMRVAFLIAATVALFMFIVNRPIRVK